MNFLDKVLAIAFPVLFLLNPAAHSFDSAPHVLVLPGHTNSLSAGPGGEVLVTCDYKTLDGRVPRPGEPCHGEPTLAISVEDLKNLRYISEAQDNNELVTRVYEKYDDIVFIVSPDFEVDFGNSGYDREVSPVTVRHPQIPDVLYNAYASKVKDVLLGDGEGKAGQEYLIGITFQPYSYHPSFSDLGNIDPLQNKWRPLANQYLIFVPANPAKTTLIHELLHCLMDSTKNENTVTSERRIQVLKNSGLRQFLAAEILPEDSKIPMPENIRAAYELTNLMYQLEHVDDVGPEEVEVNYFISKYQKDLGLSVAADDHITSFWKNSDTYRRQISILEKENFLVPTYVMRYVQEGLPLKIGDVIRPNYYRNIWANVHRLAREYPKAMLGNENNPEPGTMMYQFIHDIGTRAETLR